MDQFIAATETDSFSSVQLFANSSDLVTEPGILISGQNLAKYTVMGKVTASGKWTQWTLNDTPTGSGAALGILMHTTDASGGDKACEVYTGGFFNTQALVWPGSITAAQKANAFNGTNLQHRPIV